MRLLVVWGECHRGASPWLTGMILQRRQALLFLGEEGGHMVVEG